MAKRICMFVRNPIVNDPRVRREAASLARAGCEVFVIGTAPAGFPVREIRDGATFLRIGPFRTRLWQRVRGLLSRGRSRRADTAAPRAAVAAAGKGSRASKIGWFKRLTVRLELLLANVLWIRTGLALKADVYHANDLDTLFVALTCARLGGAKLVYDSHELFVEWAGSKLRHPPARMLWWRRLERMGIARADCVFTVSDGIAQTLADMYGCPLPTVIRNCPSLPPMNRDVEPPACLAGLNGEVRALYQGGFISGRGLTELVDAGPELRGVRVLMAGHDLPLKEQLRSRADAQEPRNVSILPFIDPDQLWRLTVAADIGLVLTQPVCKSYLFSLSNKVFEYMAAGLPVVASDLPSHRQLARETGALLLVDPYDPAAIARGIQKLADAPALRRRMGRAARHWAERKYNADVQMRLFGDACERLGASADAPWSPVSRGGA